jgi:hypothetical protein
MERCNNVQKRNLLVRSLLGLAVFATFMLLDDAPTSLEESFGRISSPSSTYYERQLRGVEDEEDRRALVKIKPFLSGMERKKKNDTAALVSKLVTPKVHHRLFPWFFCGGTYGSTLGLHRVPSCTRIPNSETIMISVCLRGARIEVLWNE